MKVIVVMAGCSGGCQGERQVFEPAQRIVVAPLDRAADLETSDLARQRRQQHFALEPGDELADAHVDAAAESDMAAGAAGDVVAVGTVPAPRVAIGGGEQ